MESKMIAVLLVVTICCTNTTSTQEDKNELSLIEDTKRNTNIVQDSVFCRLIPDTATTYKIEWGNSSFKNISTSNFEVLGSGVLGLLDKNDKVIILEQGCGTSCIYYVVLPLVSHTKERVFMFAQAYDLEHNLVAYIPEDEQVFIRVENYLTRKHYDIKESDLCPATFKADCIDSTYFKGNRFIVKWQGSKWSNDKPDLQEKEILLGF